MRSMVAAIRTVLAVCAALAVLTATPVWAACEAQQPVSLNPADWTRASTHTGEYSASGEYLQVFGAGHLNGCVDGLCDGNKLASNAAYNFQGGELRVRFVAHGGGTYMAVTASFVSFLYTKYLTTLHSYSGSLHVPDDTDLYLRLAVATDKIWTWTLAQGGYDDQGGSVLDARSGTLSDSAWESAAQGNVVLAMGDNYAGTAAYLLIKDIQICTAGGGSGETTDAGSGDVDGSGDVTALDAAMTLQIVDGAYSPTQEQEAAADADGDGGVTAADADLILHWAAQGTGLETFAAEGLDVTIKGGLILTGTADSTGAKLSWTTTWDGYAPGLDTYSVLKEQSGQLKRIAKDLTSPSYTDAAHAQATAAETYAVIGQADNGVMLVASDTVTVDPFDGGGESCAAADVEGRWLFEYYYYNGQTGQCNDSVDSDSLWRLESDGSIRDHWLGTINGYWWEVRDGKLYYYTENAPDLATDTYYYGSLNKTCDKVTGGVTANISDGSCWTARRY